MQDGFTVYPYRTDEIKKLTKFRHRDWIKDITPAEAKAYAGLPNCINGDSALTFLEAADLLASTDAATPVMPLEERLQQERNRRFPLTVEERADVRKTQQRKPSNWERR